MVQVFVDVIKKINVGQHTFCCSLESRKQERQKENKQARKKGKENLSR